MDRERRGLPVGARVSGLLIAGLIIPVGGVIIVGPHDKAWSHLNAGDCRPRSNHPQMVILHKTKADDPEVVTPGVGPSGRPEDIANMWGNDPHHSGAHLVIGGDYTACLADLVTVEAWHGNQANARSIGIEHVEEQHGVVFQAVIDAGVKVCLAIAEHCGIQLQVPKPGTYHNAPMPRFADGGSTLIGFFGHRDVTDSRGKWDPGEAIFAALIAAGAEAFDFGAAEDRAVWMDRQHELVKAGHDLVIDGIPGPATTAALKAEGYRGGIWALGQP